jgi:glycosyltransferase involved in cell wall biosynthesis
MDDVQVITSSAAAAVPPVLSILIPAYERPDVLQQVLDAYERQETESAFELIVVDDGSRDETPDCLRTFVSRTALPATVVLRPINGGPARARNSGLPHLRGELVAIVGDDVMPPPGFVESHIQWHREHPEREAALLGLVTWPASPEPTTFMRWLEHEGSAYFFAYDRLGAGEPVGGAFFYTCNVSLKRDLLSAAGEFDTSFPFASHEDLELGHRLEKAGMTLYFEPDVRAVHAHMLSVEGIARRIYRMGQSAPLYWAKVEDSSGAVRRSLRCVCTAVGGTALARWLHARVLAGARDDRQQPWRWRLLLSLSYWTGMATPAEEGTVT